MTNNHLRADDALKYAAAILRARTTWTSDVIASCDTGTDHDLELEALDQVVSEIESLAAQFGDRRRYSDGRLVKSSREIQNGLVTEHIWQPNLTSEPEQSWRGVLPSDPGVPPPGIYEVTTTPQTQDIHVRIVRVG